MRPSALVLQVLADPVAAAAEREARALGPAAHAALLAVAERLAATSVPLAQRCVRHAVPAWTAFGPHGFARWLALGEELAAGDPPLREGALAFFAVAPAALGRLEVAAAWCALGRRVVARGSRRLAGIFFERTAAVLARADAAERLAPWVGAGLALQETRGWRGAFVAQAFFESAPASVVAVAPEAVGRWAELALVLAPVVAEREFFADAAGLGSLDAADQGRVLALTGALAASAPREAYAVYRALPAAVAGLAAAERTALLGTLTHFGAGLAAPLAAFAPLAGAVLRAVPVAARAQALALVEELAGGFPAAALAALRVLPRLYEESADIPAWFAAGTAIAADNAEAGRAYFALESRTSLRRLRVASSAAALEESEGVWRKLIQMMSGAPARVRRLGALTLRPPLEEAHQVTLPEVIDRLATHDENSAVFRLLAAQIAGRREFGTYAVAGLTAYLRHPERPALLEELFLLAEGVRIHHRLCDEYRGLAADIRRVAGLLLDAWAREERAGRETVLDALLALAVVAPGPIARPPWLDPGLAQVVARLTTPLAAPAATVEDSIRVAHALSSLLTVRVLPASEADALLTLDDLDLADAFAPVADGTPAGAVAADADEPPAGDADLRLNLAPHLDERTLGGRPLSLEELRRLLAAGTRIDQGRGEGVGPGLPITDLAGKLAPEPGRERPGAGAGARPAPGARDALSPEGPTYFYDEWDHRIGDYRSRWCRLVEVTLAGDAGEFYARALADHVRLIPEVRRLFQRIRPEQYRSVRGLEDGEDFDLNAVVEARIELRARRSPSTRLYRARVREARDVATLFLLDMSASTDEPLEPPGTPRPPRRIIDAIKEALVIMSEALETLGDAYAIYGFSGQGRDGVEFYPVKGFGERLGTRVKSRIGGIEPRRSTRMGTALRHAIHKFAPIGARAKHLILLSDGFPQDHDYGDDRRSHEYGIRDTAVALREADAAGITPFCITVDRGGHDYLRRMCDAQRYLVIEDVNTLPRELPKVYRKVVRP